MSLETPTEENSVFDMDTVCVLWALHEAVEDICKRQDNCGFCPLTNGKGKPCLKMTHPPLHEIGNRVERAGLLLGAIPCGWEEE